MIIKTKEEKKIDVGLSNTYYHYKGFEFCLNNDNTMSAKKKYYLCLGSMHGVLYGNDKDKLIKSACNYIDEWHACKENKIYITEDYTNYKNNSEYYSNYKYSNTGLHIVTSKDIVKGDVSIEEYLKNPLKYTNYTSKNIKLVVIELVKNEGEQA